MTRLYEVEIIQADHSYSLEELCQRIRLEEEFIIKCVDYGITEVSSPDTAKWRFPQSAIPRLQTAFRLQRDLDINFTGLAVVLDLLEENSGLRRQLHQLRSKLHHWEP
ncbi:MAG: chaperone modulator CbpM [Pseudohongiellaceae bacterium]